MSKKNYDVKKFIEMQLFFQSHSKNEIADEFDISIQNDEMTDAEYMFLIEDMLSMEDSESGSIFGKYKH